METITEWIAVPLRVVMGWCTGLFTNYGLAIILFTFLTKIILLPLSVWVQKNSIKMVEIQPAVNRIKAKYFGDTDTIMDEQSRMYKEKGYKPLISLIPLIVQIILLMGVVAVVKEPGNYNMHFLGFDLTQVPAETGGKNLLVPLVAALSAAVLCIAQNRSNVLQAEQSKLSQWGLSAFSVGLSLYLGFFVSAGTALYWVASNLFAVVQLYALNAVIPPKKYVDYEALEESRRELAALEALGGKKKTDKALRQREKADYKRFFGIANKHIVFYSERSGFYKYYKEIIEYLLAKTTVRIHYVTNDPNDVIFEMAKEQPRILPYYISVKKLIPLMMKLECDIMVMTTPDLNNFYLKRSFMKKDIEYVYVPHDPSSMHMSFREHALDNFDTVFCTGPHIAREVRASEKHYGTQEKNLVEFGYPLIEDLIAKAEALPAEERAVKQILIGPSWQEDNLMDSVIHPLIDNLYAAGYKVIVRPHPEYVKRFSEKLDMLKSEYADREGERLVFEFDFSSNVSVYSSDLLITDWSGVGIEFGFATCKPVIFINTKMKVENPNWEAIGITPEEIRLRNVLGRSLNKEEIGEKLVPLTEELLSSDAFRETAKAERERYFYHLGSRGEYGARYLIERLTHKK